MNKILYFNEHPYNVMCKEIELAAGKFQSLLTEYNALNLFKVKEMAELLEMATGNESYIKSKIGETLEPQVLGKFQMKRSAMVDALELPDFTAFNAAAVECMECISEASYLKTDGTKVSVNQKQLEELKNDYCVIADTPAKVKLIETHEKASKAMSEFYEALAVFGLAIQPQPHDLLNKFFQVENKEVRVREYFYAQHSLKPV